MAWITLPDPRKTYSRPWDVRKKDRESRHIHAPRWRAQPSNFGHLWTPDWDPEGLLSTIPAVATTLAGDIQISGSRQRIHAAGPAAHFVHHVGYLRQALGKIFLLDILAQIGKRQDSNRMAAGKSRHGLVEWDVRLAVDDDPERAAFAVLQQQHDALVKRPASDRGSPACR